jgi:hypothetical protein
MTIEKLTRILWIAVALVAPVVIVVAVQRFAH